MKPEIAFVVLWAGWAVSWAAAAFWSDRTEKRAGGTIYRIVLLVGAAIFFIPAHHYRGALRFWSIGRDGAWICVVLTAAGIAFAWWARVHLGRLWSGAVTRKPDHRVVDTGPYGIVRHPIYTGLLLSVFATAAAKGTLPGIAGAALLLLGIRLKAGLEERFLTAELGEAAYGDYRRRVPVLLPFGPR